jgi:Rrf2 family transcriptional regulator, nitric oxide-sensitive transcriptional repressor
MHGAAERILRRQQVGLSMQLTRYTDLALRTLIALGLDPGRQQTVTAISRAYGISRHHLVKVVARLAERGYVETVRGKGGGMRLARLPAAIRVGDVVRDMEAELGVVECLQADGGQCAIAPVCRLKGVLRTATRQFLAALDQYTLEDMLRQRAPVARLLGIPVSVARRA